jgi:hypothetical protein
MERCYLDVHSLIRGLPPLDAGLFRRQPAPNEDISERNLGYLKDLSMPTRRSAVGL